jgi:AAA domain
MADRLAEAIKNVKATQEAASVAAADAFSKEPLKGVGTDPWIAMYEYAKIYVASLGDEDLPSEVGQSCALCQQPLTSDGSERLKRFSAFVSGEAAKAARLAAHTLVVASLGIEELDVPAKAQIEMDLAEYTLISDAAAATSASIIAFCERAAERKAALLGQAAGQTQSVPDLLPSLALNVRSNVDALAAEASVLKDQATQDQTRSADVARLDALKDAKKLKENLPTFIARLGDIHAKAKLEECKKLVATGPLSTRITAVRRTAVAGGLQERINAEITNLDLGHIPFAVSDQSENGQSYFEISLAAPVTAENTDILSEGEQRALALACFLGEIGDDESKSGIIVDDPVSSLDHLRIRKVAERLVAEAGKGRQVMIFTHNLLFYNEVADAAAQAPTPVPVAKRIVTKSFKEGVGLISEQNEPWTAQKVNERIVRLRSRQAELAKVTDFDTDDYRRAAKDYYTDLRETWERLVEEVLLYTTVERFNSDIKTMRLKGVVVEDEDYRKVFWAMKRVSERSGHDMAAGKNIPVPRPDDMKKDIDELDTYRSAVKARAKLTEKAREAMEKPPEATTM